MKIGTLIFLLMITLIGLGALIVDDLQTHEKLVEVEGRLAGLTVQVEELTAQLQGALEQLRIYAEQGAQDRQKIEELIATITLLEGQIGTLNKRIDQLTFENNLLRSQGSFVSLLRSNPLIFASLVFFQLLSSGVRYAKRMGIWKSGPAGSPNAKYVRLSDSELEQILRHRRNSR